MRVTHDHLALNKASIPTLAASS